MPGADRDDESGQYTETYPTEEFLDAIADAGDMAGTQDVADYVGSSYETAYKKLRKLEGSGVVESKKVANARVWMRAGSGTPSSADSPGGESGVTPSEDEAAQSPSPTDGGDGASRAPAESGGHDEWEDLAADLRAHLKATGQPPKTAHGRDVILDVLERLRERGPMKTGELRDEIYPDYTDHWDGSRAMWNAVGRYLEDIPGTEKPGYGEWGYAGDDVLREAIAGER